VSNVTLPRCAKSRAREIAVEATVYFRKAGRFFPWRDERDPLYLAIAEILLQKTRAKSAVPAYRALVRRYPSADRLACANVSDIEATL